MYESNLKVAKYEPLTFQCVHCDQEFAVSDNSLEKLGADVSDHLTKNHPEFLQSERQKKRSHEEACLRGQATQVV